MSAARLLTIVGLFFNLFGALMLWKFVPPNPGKIHKGVFMVTTKTVGDAVSKEVLYKKLTNLGLITLAVGFFLQLIGAFI